MLLTILKRFFITISLFSSVFCLAQNTSEKAVIKGTFQLDSTWSNKVYLSLIPSFNKMYTISNSMIVAVSELDNDGHFKFDISYLPEEDKLYRLHIAKKEAPPASLIIGGKDENHLFLIGNNRSLIVIEKESAASSLNTCNIISNQQSTDLKRIDYIVNFLNNTDVEETYLKRELITKAINEKLRFVADSSSHPLVSLYALYKSKFESNYSINKQFYSDYLEKWNHNNSDYFLQFRNSLPIKTEHKSNYTYIIGILCFILGVFSTYYIFIVRKSNKLKKLSIQERKILERVQSGKTNKEISEEFNIGLSTVKSHVSNIYSKLNIKSRKEAADLK